MKSIARARYISSRDPKTIASRRRLGDEEAVAIGHAEDDAAAAGRYARSIAAPSKEPAGSRITDDVSSGGSSDGLNAAGAGSQIRAPAVFRNSWPIVLRLSAQLWNVRHSNEPTTNS
jgi:hypothetical protein